MADKKKKNGTKKTGKTVGRRSFVKVGAVAIGAAAAGSACAGGASTPIGTASPQLNAEKIQAFVSDPALAKTWLATVKDVAHQLATDATLREQFLTNTEAVRLLKLFNDNQSVLEPLVGKYDGRTLEGRLTKMVIASEVFDNVAGPDFAYEGLEYQDDKCCSNFNGCCIVHSWGSYYGQYC